MNKRKSYLIIQGRNYGSPEVHSVSAENTDLENWRQVLDGQPNLDQYTITLITPFERPDGDFSIVQQTVEKGRGYKPPTIGDTELIHITRDELTGNLLAQMGADLQSANQPSEQQKGR